MVFSKNIFYATVTDNIVVTMKTFYLCIDFRSSRIRSIQKHYFHKQESKFFWTAIIFYLGPFFQTRTHINISDIVNVSFFRRCFVFPIKGLVWSRKKCYRLISGLHLKCIFAVFAKCSFLQPPYFFECSFGLSFRYLYTSLLYLWYGYVPDLSLNYWILPIRFPRDGKEKIWKHTARVMVGEIMFRLPATWGVHKGRNDEEKRLWKISKSNMVTHTMIIALQRYK